MKVLLSWLREFAPIEGDAASIAAELTDLGMEVEEVVEIGAGLAGVVAARVLEVRSHPDADRIRLVDVDAGDGEALQICCGASNMAAGDVVPLAAVGAVLPGGLEIAARKLRGQMSHGMLCSARELELGDDHAGILILPPDVTPGTPLVDALGITPDVAFGFDTLPNRPDTLSMVGVARDLAARQRVPFSLPEPQATESGADVGDLLDVELVDGDLCGRFVARVISGVELGPSPRWMAQRLLGAGMRPINNVVDCSNYVMLELGLPNHTYDLATIAGARLRVRWATDGETIRTLDGIERVLSSSDGVIADGDDRAIGIAGVMGGASTEISSSTTDVALELAWWDPGTVAGSAASLNLHSEASLRFKRGTDPELVELGAKRFAELLAAASAGGSTPPRLHPGVLDRRGDLPSPSRVRVRTERVNALLGTSLDRELIAGLVGPIGFRCEAVGDGDLDVVVPSWRPDSTIEEDVVEEVARQYGLGRIPRCTPTSPHTGELRPDQRARRRLRRVLIGAGCSEAMPMPFLAPGDLERCGLPADGLLLANPLAAEESVLRTSLRPGLLASVAHNAAHRQPGVRLFETGRVFGTGAGGVITDVVASEIAGRVLDGEREHLGVVLAGAEAPAAVTLLELVLTSLGVGPFVLTAATLPGLHRGRGAAIEVAGVPLGEVGEIDPGVLDAHGIAERVAWVGLDLSTLWSLPVPVIHAQAVSRFPSTDVDLAFVVGDEVPAAAVAATIRSASGDLLRQVELFDVYRGEGTGAGRRSLAYRLRFQAADRTLTDVEVAEVRRTVIDEVTGTHGAELRG
jgi:phenylalanyl-tRNA synthetase beta chain